MTETKEQRREPHRTLAVYFAIGVLGPLAGSLLIHLAGMPTAAGYALGVFAAAAIGYPFLRRAQRADGLPTPTFGRWMAVVVAGLAAGLAAAWAISRL